MYSENGLDICWTPPTGNVSLYCARINVVPLYCDPEHVLVLLNLTVFVHNIYPSLGMHLKYYDKFNCQFLALRIFFIH